MGRLIFPDSYNKYSVERDFMIGDSSRFILCYPWIDNPYWSWDPHKGKLPTIEIRKFIEQCCTDDVAVLNDNHTEYHVPEHEQGKYDPWGYQISIGWKEFWFEEQKDFTIFKLRFGKPDQIDIGTLNLSGNLTDRRKVYESHTVPTY